MTYSPLKRAWALTALAGLLAAASSAQAAAVVTDPRGDLFSPFDRGDPRNAAFDIVKAGVKLSASRPETGPVMFGDYMLSAAMAADIVPTAPVDYVWVVNRSLGAGAERTLFADEAFGGVQGDGFVLARADGTLTFEDLSGVSESAGRALGRVIVDGDRIDIELPSDALLAHRGGTLPDGFTPSDVRFALLTLGARPVEGLARAARFEVADAAPDGGYLMPAGHDPVTVAPAPEPGAWLLALTGLGLAGQALRTRRAYRATAPRRPEGSARG